MCLILGKIQMIPAEAHEILNRLHGKELSNILKSLGLPSLPGKSKKRQIDILLKHHGEGKLDYQ